MHWASAWPQRQATVGEKLACPCRRWGHQPVGSALRIQAGAWGTGNTPGRGGAKSTLQSAGHAAAAACDVRRTRPPAVIALPMDAATMQPMASH